VRSSRPRSSLLGMNLKCIRPAPSGNGHLVGPDHCEGVTFARAQPNGETTLSTSLSAAKSLADADADVEVEVAVAVVEAEDAEDAEEEEEEERSWRMCRSSSS
jgi:hypothetical protein